MSDPLVMLTWREIQDHLDKGVLPERHASVYLGDLLSLIAVQAPELLNETTQAYGLADVAGELPATEKTDL